MRIVSLITAGHSRESGQLPLRCPPTPRDPIPQGTAREAPDLFVPEK